MSTTSNAVKPGLSSGWGRRSTFGGYNRPQVPHQGDEDEQLESGGSRGRRGWIVPGRLRRSRRAGQLARGKLAGGRVRGRKQASDSVGIGQTRGVRGSVGRGQAGRFRSRVGGCQTSRVGQSDE